MKMGEKVEMVDEVVRKIRREGMIPISYELQEYVKLVGDVGVYLTLGDYNLARKTVSEFEVNRKFSRQNHYEPFCETLIDLIDKVEKLRLEAKK